MSDIIGIIAVVILFWIYIEIRGIGKNLESLNLRSLERLHTLQDIRDFNKDILDEVSQS